MAFVATPGVAATAQSPFLLAELESLALAGTGLGRWQRCGLLAWGFVAESLIFGFLPGLGRFGPVHAQDGLVDLTTRHLLGPAPGELVLVAWAAALSALGTAVAVRRDVA